MMIDTIRARVLAVLDKLSGKSTGGSQSLPELGEMGPALTLWQEMISDHAPWINGNVQSCGLAAAVSGEQARLTLTGLETEINGAGRAEYISQQFARFQRQNLRTALDMGCAGGTLIFKPYVDGGNILIDCVPSWRFVPVCFNAMRDITGAAFLESITRGGYTYTRLELHRLTQDGYTVQNLAFRSATPGVLGSPCRLGEVTEWSELEEQMQFGLNGGKLDRPLFAVFRVPWANTIDNNSPLGVSVFSRAVNLIRNADEQWSRILWEYEGSELAVHADDAALRIGGGKFAMPKHDRRLFHGLNLDAGDRSLYAVFSPEIRDTSLFNGFNQILRRIEFACNLAYGTLSDPQNVDKTAEEVRASKQRSVTAVAELQGALQAALEQLVWCMDFYADAYRLAPAGESKLHCTWGDGVQEDVGVEFQRRKALVDAGYLRPEALLSWYFGVPETDALKMLPDSSTITFDA